MSSLWQASGGVLTCVVVVYLQYVVVVVHLDPDFVSVTTSVTVVKAMNISKLDGKREHSLTLGLSFLHREKEKTDLAPSKGQRSRPTAAAKRRKRLNFGLA